MRDSGGDWSQYAHALMEGDFHLNLRLLPSLPIGGGMVSMALGLLWRSRLAWVMAVLLAATGAVNTLLTVHSHVDACWCISHFYYGTAIWLAALQPLQRRRKHSLHTVRRGDVALVRHMRQLLSRRCIQATMRW